jgi:hypothetical protein
MRRPSAGALCAHQPGQPEKGFGNADIERFPLAALAAHICVFTGRPVEAVASP